jgi:hypothetical protein
MNGFDDFDTQVSAEEFYGGWGEDEADYHADWREEQAQEDTQPDDPQGFGDGFGDDGDALASAGFGTDEDYGYYGEE